MKHKKVLELKNKLKQLKGIKSAEVNYAIFENIERAENSLKALGELEKNIEDTIKEFTEALTDLGKKLSTVNGIVKTKQQLIGSDFFTAFDIPEDKIEEFDRGVECLREKYAESIKEHDDKRADFIKIVNEGESLFVPYLIKKHQIPSDIETEAMAILFPLVKKTETDKQ